MSGSTRVGEGVSARPESSSATRTEPSPQPIGAYLSAQRRLRGISVEELSRQTRIPLRSLQRLESGAFDADVDGFVRGFVRTVAEALGLDPDETLNRTLTEPGQISGLRVRPRLSIPRVAGAILVVALLVGIGFAVQLIAVSLADDGAAPRSGSPIVVRRDPVAALAEAQGVAALQPTPARALASVLAPGRADEDASRAPTLPEVPRPEAPRGDPGAPPVAGP